MTEEFDSDSKKWLFNESIRIEREKQELEEERKLFDIQKELILRQKQKLTLERNRLDAEKILYDKKWTDLDRERNMFNNEKEAYMREQEELLKQIRDERNRLDIIGTDADPSLFFKGIKNGSDLKKRYKELTKIYHPDNECGSNEVLFAINEEYEKLKKYYIG
ncbi:MAG TPA: hypothetical protein DCX21_02985 [Eubacterium sp.]|nr:hypothetical protein [Eubacterium sp.]HBZ52828.1 hypothetical protein [Eubacterium sp.]